MPSLLQVLHAIVSLSYVNEPSCEHNRGIFSYIYLKVLAQQTLVEVLLFEELRRLGYTTGSFVFIAARHHHVPKHSDVGIILLYLAPTVGYYWLCKD